MLTSALEKSVLIFGCGNILFGDDGFGPAVVQQLQEQHRLPEDILAQDVGTGIREILFDLSATTHSPARMAA
ncbi:MAG: hydrogenase maturation protease [Syntrophobacterales bacterium]